VVFHFPVARLSTRTASQNLLDSIAAADRTLSAERTRVASLRAQLARAEGYFGKVRRFFGGGTNPADLRSRISLAEESVKRAEIACGHVRARATPVFDIMLDYPPDWSLRSAAVAARDKVCTNCGSSKTLQAHHIVPLSQGGTNRLSNLTLLCERCHQRAHGGKDFSGTRSTEQLAIADRVQALQRAIVSGDDVEFMYRKRTATSFKRRRVTPHALVQIDHEHDDGQTLCLRAYCHLRCAERHFALKRMRGLRYTKD
jgi:hypothetical protein